MDFLRDLAADHRWLDCRRDHAEEAVANTHQAAKECVRNATMKSNIVIGIVTLVILILVGVWFWGQGHQPVRDHIKNKIATNEIRIAECDRQMRVLANQAILYIKEPTKLPEPGEPISMLIDTIIEALKGVQKQAALEEFVKRTTPLRGERDTLVRETEKLKQLLALK